MKHIVLAGLAALLMVGCNNANDNTGGTSDATKNVKDSINQQKDAVDANVKDAKKQMDANADAAKAQLDAEKKKAEAAATSTNK